MPDRADAGTKTCGETDAAAGGAREARPAVRVQGLWKRFGDQVAVAGIDLELPAGKFIGLVGPNGAGKTTTLSMVTGLLRPDMGKIEVAGHALESVGGIEVQRRRVQDAEHASGFLPASYQGTLFRRGEMLSGL